MVLALLGLWALGRQLRAEAPLSRRVIRSVSMAVRVAMLAPFVYGLSGVDPDDDPQEYALAWGLAVGLLGLSVLLALADTANSLRLRARGEHALEERLLAELDRAEQAAGD